MRTDQRHGAPLYVVPEDARPPMTDADLARALQQAHPEAFAEAWMRFSPMVYGAIARALGPEDEVHDLTQEVFLRIFRRVTTLEDPSALRSFVYSIAVRVIRAELRRRWVRRVMRLEDPRRLPDRPAPAQEDDGTETMTHLYAILDRLRPSDRTVYVLRHLEGLSLEETAAAAGVSLATVKRRLARAAERVAHHVRKDPVLREYAPRREGEP